MSILSHTYIFTRPLVLRLIVASQNAHGVDTFVAKTRSQLCDEV